MIKRLHVAFQMEPMEETNRLENHTLWLMQEACERGHVVYHYQPKHIWLIDGVVMAKLRKVDVNLAIEPHYSYGDWEEVELASMDVILFRQDPPVDMEYITNTYLLERISDQVVMVNNPYWIRNATDKLYPFDFPELMPPTLVTSDVAAMEKFKAAYGDVVVKPLYGFHGHGIERYEVGEQMIVDGSETLLLQPFIPEIKQGNKRVVFLDGEIAGALITKPSEGEFKVYRDSVDFPYELNARDLEICDKVRAKFKERGLIFVGIDIIGDYLTEINLGSVGSVFRLDQVYGGSFAAKFWECVEGKCS